MFNASSSKSNSSTSWGALHFTRQPRSCEVAPTLRQFRFTFRPYYPIQVTVHHLYFTSNVLQMIARQMKPGEWYQYQIDGNQWAAKKVRLCQFFAHKYHKSSKIKQSNSSKAAKSRAAKTALLPCKLRKLEPSLHAQRESFPSSDSDHLVLEMISMSQGYDVQVVGSWRLFALKVPCTSCFLGQYGPLSERTGGQLESCPCWLGTRSNHGFQWTAGVVIWCSKTQTSDGRTHSTCLSTQIFLA